ncbi:MAG: hypothetical protein KJP00_05800 [Bacteroidia bacterium]|nr:hypothetical protein [Bacteroidia bacterium]
MQRFVLIIFVVILLFSCKSVKKQVFSSEEIETPHTWDRYDLIETIHQPIRTIRLSIHVFQDSLGAGNFNPFNPNGEKSEDWYWLNGLIDDASQKMGQLERMNMESSSTHIKDSRLRYQVVGLYTWKNQELYELNRVAYGVGNKMFDFVLQQPEVNFKDNSLHLFLAGNVNRDNSKIASRGIASGLADKRWTVLYNYYHQYLNNKNFWPAGLVSHEIGHNLGLRHTWNQDDGCSDTPQNAYHLEGNPKNFQCWNDNEPRGFRCDETFECSNNLMDYNAHQNALTQCQLQKIYANINRNKGGLNDILSIKESRLDSMYISGPPTCKETGIYRLENCPLGYRIEWYVSPRKAVQQPTGIGNRVTIKVADNYRGKVILSFRIYQDEEVVDFDRTIKLKPLYPGT